MKTILIISLFVLQSLNAYNEHRQGLFGGIGVEVASSKKISETNRYYGPTLPWEIGYGINENILIYFSMEKSTSIESTTLVLENLSGLGLSYYINNDHYIKTTIGPSKIKASSLIGEDTLNGIWFSLGYGKSLSKTSSIEFTYLRLFFDRMQKELNYFVPAVDRSYSAVSITYKYRWF